jgi:hypothetical protein
MRPADINRAKRALDHLEAAMTQLRSIKYENLSGQDYTLKQSVVRQIQEAKWVTEDFIRIGGGEV